MKKGFIFALILGVPAQAQNFTTQGEVQPILEMTRANWVGIGTATGRDLLYFSHLLSWRCGVDRITFGLNGAAPDVTLEMEPCHSDTNQPNAIRELPFVSFPFNTITSVTVAVTFPDGEELRQSYERSAIRID